MAIVVEDGSIVAGANSYVSRADAIAYAASRGVTLTDDIATDQLLIKATDFIDSHEPRFKGVRVDRDQPLSWPRYDVFINDYAWTHTEIPTDLIKAQNELVLEINAGVDLYNPEPVKTAKRERVEGAVEIEYFGRDSDGRMTRSSRAMALLDRLFNKASSFNLVADRT